MLAALKASGVRQLGSVRLLVLDASVELIGEVPSYYLKQLAQESIRPAALGLQIVNQIRVSSATSSDHDRQSSTAILNPHHFARSRPKRIPK
jgi:hypothetical protein